jgi:hypothetical protein
MPTEEPLLAFDPKTLRLFNDGVSYKGFETGLYPGGNTIPEGHQKQGVRLASSIVPIGKDGKRDDQNGKIVALIIGHSNCQQYFDSLISVLNFNEVLNPRFEFVNAAVGGQQLHEIVQLQGKVWDKAEELLVRPGYSPSQVQILFFHTTYHTAKNKESMPVSPFPQHMQSMQRDLTTVLQHCVKLFPNLKIAYQTCDGLRHFTGWEPHVWHEAFAVKWLIEAQIKKTPGTEYEGSGKKLPWLQWGPYIWDNTWNECNFLDGVHPAPNSKNVFVKKYWDLLSRDPVAKSWLLKCVKARSA